MRLPLALLLTLLSACAGLNPAKTLEPTGRLSAEERKALYQQARERYIATTRPILQAQFQDRCPTMPEAGIEVLVNEAL